MKKVFLIVMIGLMTMTVFGQEKGCEKQCNQSCKDAKPNKEAKEWMIQKKEQRRAYIIKEMGLTVTEEAAFKAIYSDYTKKIGVAKREMNKAMKALNDTLKDEEFEKNLDVMNVQMLEQSKITDEFYKEMKKALPIRKVYLYYKADKEFNKLMMKEMRPQKQKVEK